MGIKSFLTLAPEPSYDTLPMDNLQLKGQNLGRVFNFRSGHLHVAHLWDFQVKLLILKLKTQPKQLLGSLPLYFALPALP